MPFIIDGTLGGTFPSWTTATRPATPTAGQTGYNSTLAVLETYNGSSWVAGGSSAPTVTTYTSGSGTYTTPTGAKYLQVQMVGGGGGGGGSGNSSSGATGGTGGTTTFGSSLLTCGGGGGGQNGGLGTAGGVAGIATLNSPATGLSSKGNRGFGYQGYNQTVLYTVGPTGGISPIGSSDITSGSTQGAGGSGGGCDGTAAVLGTAGGSGAYINAIIASPTSTYSYAIGAGGTAGGAGSGGNVGIAGGAGLIIVTAYF